MARRRELNPPADFVAFPPKEEDKYRKKTLPFKGRLVGSFKNNVISP